MHMRPVGIGFPTRRLPAAVRNTGRGHPSRHNRDMTEHPPPPLSVLVVEDLDDTAQSTADLLALCGHRVRIATRGREALTAAAGEVPDVVLLDIGLPEMDGWEVARRLRDQTRGKQPFIVAVTGYGTDGDRLRSADSGVDLHLVKPADPVALVGLLSRVGTILAEHRAFVPAREGCL